MFKMTSKFAVMILVASGSAMGWAADEVVTAKAYFSVDRLPAGKATPVAVVVEIKPDWHINANPPNPEEMIATQVNVKSKLGIKLSAANYPKGKNLKIEDLGTISGYEGKLTIFGTLEIPANAGGQNDELEILVKYQACNHSQCLPPKTLKIVGKVSVARPGDAVNPVNEAVFKPLEKTDKNP